MKPAGSLPPYTMRICLDNVTQNIPILCNMRQKQNQTSSWPSPTGWGFNHLNPTPPPQKKKRQEGGHLSPDGASPHATPPGSVLARVSKYFQAGPRTNVKQYLGRFPRDDQMQEDQVPPVRVQDQLPGLQRVGEQQSSCSHSWNFLFALYLDRDPRQQPIWHGRGFWTAWANSWNVYTMNFEG